MVDNMATIKIYSNNEHESNLTLGEIADIVKKPEQEPEFKVNAELLNPEVPNLRVVHNLI